MMTLALDVDGVLLDPDRGGAGPWQRELYRRHAIAPSELRDAFFAPSWDDVVNGRKGIEGALASALRKIESSLDVEDALSCWFDADFVLIQPAIELAQRAATAGVRVVLATNQEHRRAAYLRERLGSQIPLADVLYSADLGYQKHEPAFFDLASDRLGLTAKERKSVVFVDDIANNVEVARSSGWTAVHATQGGSWCREVAALLGLATDSASDQME